MHRLKLFILLLFLVGGLSLASYMVVRNDFGPRIQRSVMDDLQKTQMAMQAIKIARARRLVQVADWLSRNAEAGFSKAMTALTDDAKHVAAFAAIRTIAPILQKAGRQSYAPDVTLVLDPTGKIIARDRFANAWGQTLRFPLLQRVVAEKTRDQDIWRYREQNTRMMTAVAAPIFEGANVVGVLALLYEHGHKMALEDKGLYKTEVAYFHASAAPAGSAPTPTDHMLFGSSLSEPSQMKALRDFISPELKALAEGKVVGPASVDVAGKKYLALAATFEGDYSDRGGGFILAASLDEALAPVSAFLGRFPYIAAGFLVVAILLGLFLLRSAQAPYDRIEQGVMEMVAGHTDLRFDANLPGGAGTLAHALNLLVAQLQGRPPPDREPEAEAWDELLIEGTVAKPQQAAAHKGDIDTQVGGLTFGYYERLYQQYLDARKRAGDTGEVNFDSFVEKVRKNEEILRKKHNCTAVKFDVLLKEGKVVLKPVPIKK